MTVCAGNSEPQVNIPLSLMDPEEEQADEPPHMYLDEVNSYPVTPSSAGECSSVRCGMHMLCARRKIGARIACKVESCVSG